MLALFLVPDILEPSYWNSFCYLADKTSTLALPSSWSPFLAPRSMPPPDRPSLPLPATVHAFSRSLGLGLPIADPLLTAI